MAGNPLSYKDEAIAILADACDEAIHQANEGYSSYEVMLFPVKRTLARKWLVMPDEYRRRALDDPEYSLLVLEASSVSSIDSVTELAGKIMARAKRFETHAGLCIRVKRNLRQQIEASDGSRESVRMVLDRMIFPAYR